jgi:hypothetical protein
VKHRSSSPPWASMRRDVARLVDDARRVIDGAASWAQWLVPCTEAGCHYLRDCTPCERASPPRFNPPCGRAQSVSLGPVRKSASNLWAHANRSLRAIPGTRPVGPPLETSRVVLVGHQYSTKKLATLLAPSGSRMRAEISTMGCSGYCPEQPQGQRVSPRPYASPSLRQPTDARPFRGQVGGSPEVGAACIKLARCIAAQHDTENLGHRRRTSVRIGSRRLVCRLDMKV